MVKKGKSNLVGITKIGGDMNNGKDYNCKRGAWCFRHPPPTAKTIGESRFPLRSWTQFHPPPCPVTRVIKTEIIYAISRNNRSP